MPSVKKSGILFKGKGTTGTMTVDKRVGLVKVTKGSGVKLDFSFHFPEAVLVKDYDLQDVKVGMVLMEVADGKLKTKETEIGLANFQRLSVDTDNWGEVRLSFTTICDDGKVGGPGFKVKNARKSVKKSSRSKVTKKK